MVVGPTGILAPNQTIELGEDRAVALRNPILSSTNVVISQDPTLSIDVPSLSLEDWAVWMQGTKAVSATGTGPYTYSYDLSLTATNSPKSWTMIVTDGQQAFKTNYSMATSCSISADRNGLTTARLDLFAQAIAKDSTTLADTVDSTVTYMAGRLWKPYFHTSFPTVSQGTAYSYFTEWSIDWNTGVTRQSYQAGSLNMSTHAESAPFSGNISFTVSATSSAVTELYDAFTAGTTKYLRLEWTNSGAGAALRSANICTAFVITELTPIASAEDGLTTHSVSGRLVSDVSTSKTLLVELKTGLATLP
jgi:hypothetical protein